MKHSKIFLKSGVLVIISAAMLFVMDTILARLLGASQYGILNYALIMGGLFAVLASAGFPASSIRFVSEYEATKQWGYLKGFILFSFVIVTLLCCCIVLLIFFITNANFIMLDTESRESLGYSLLLIFPLGLGLWKRNVLRGLHNLVASLLPKDIVHPLAVIVLCLFYSVKYASETITIVWTSLVAIEYLSFYYIWKYLPRDAKKATPQYKLKAWIYTSLMMVFTTLLQLGLARWDILILGITRDMLDVGIYNAALRVSLVQSLVFRAIGMVISPMISASYHSGEYKQAVAIVHRSILYSTLASLPIFVVIMFFSDKILLLFGKEFVGASTVLCILAGGQFIQAICSPMQFFLLMTGRELVVTKIMIFITVFSLGFGFYVISRYGTVGASCLNGLSLILINGAVTIYFYVITSRLRKNKI